LEKLGREYGGVSKGEGGGGGEMGRKQRGEPRFSGDKDWKEEPPRGAKRLGKRKGLIVS
jgi:hypothetical protein